MRAQPDDGAGHGTTSPPADAFRHQRILCWMLALDVPALLAYSLWQSSQDHDRSLAWTAPHAVAAAAGGLAIVVLWRRLGRARRRPTGLAAELTSTRIDAERRHEAVSNLFVNLARRNQSLIDRQMTLIAELEHSERSPEGLAELFRLDHLATRIRRNAESLLVLSGDDPPRSWGRPVPLGEVVRAAAAEVEDYRRVDVRVSEHLEIAGRAVADLAHLLAELIENATTYSPSTCDVRVRSFLTPDDPPTVVVAVEDSGIGMAEPDRQAANRQLGEPLEIDLRGHTMGVPVVSRLAQRYGLQVRLAHTRGGGLTALVELPSALVTERPPFQASAAPATAGRPGDTFQASTASTPAGRSGGLRPGDAGTPVDPPTGPVPRPATSAPAARPARTAERHVHLVPGLGDRSPQHPQAPGTSAPLRSSPAEVDVRAGVTPEGLMRRVPGAGLAPGLRRRQVVTEAAFGAAATAAGPATGAGIGVARTAAGPVTGASIGPADGIPGDPGSPATARALSGDATAHSPRPAPTDDREQTSSMLSRFQVSQRAGRALAMAPAGSLAHSDGDPYAPVPQESS